MKEVPKNAFGLQDINAFWKAFDTHDVVDDSEEEGLFYL
jgi:hypothetical protein